MVSVFITPCNLNCDDDYSMENIMVSVFTTATNGLITMIIVWRTSPRCLMSVSTSTT